jgi:hypothetical protein
METYALLMYADPAHTQAMTDEALFIVEQKHAELRKDLTESGELIGGAGLALPDQTVTVTPGRESPGPLATAAIHLTAYYEIETARGERAREIAARVLDDHVTAVEVRRIHSVAPKA